jgi:NADPH2:quinone reductase
MKTTIFRYSDYDKLKIVEREMPELKEGQLLVKVTHAAINSIDNTLRAGGINARVGFPVILGNEGAGVIVKGNSEFPKSTRVIISCITDAGSVRGIATEGSWQEYLALYPGDVIKTPDTVTDEIAASFPVGYFSAYVCLDKAEFRPGKSVLSIAVGGGVGNTGSQLAKALGASTVITTAGSAEKAEIDGQADESFCLIFKKNVGQGFDKG